MKFRKGDKVVPVDTEIWGDGIKYKVITGCGGGTIPYYYIDDNEIPWPEEFLTLYQDNRAIEKIHYSKVEQKEKLSFREVITQMKDGDVWEVDGDSSGLVISKDKNQVTVKDIRSGVYIFYSDDVKFTLKRKKCTFQEAFEAYEEGKEIESIAYKYKLINGEHCYYWEEEDKWECMLSEVMSISIKEIQGKWYINDRE